MSYEILCTLQWRHNRCDCVSNHQPHHCLLNHLFWHRSSKTSTIRVTGLCEGNSPVTGEFPAQRASNAEDISIRWRHHVFYPCLCRVSCITMLYWAVCYWEPIKPVTLWAAFRKTMIIKRKFTDDVDAVLAFLRIYKASIERTVLYRCLLILRIMGYSMMCCLLSANFKISCLLHSLTAQYPIFLLQSFFIHRWFYWRDIFQNGRVSRMTNYIIQGSIIESTNSA